MFINTNFLSTKKISDFETNTENEKKNLLAIVSWETET